MNPLGNASPTSGSRSTSTCRPGAPLSGMAADVRAGLDQARSRSCRPRYFYDERGSELFEEITRLPEYYPTRAERAILERHSAGEICAAAGNPTTLIELGSGSAAKTRVLLDAMGGAGCLRGLRPGRHLGADHAARPRRRSPPSTGSPSTASSATSSSTSSASRSRGRA